MLSQEELSLGSASNSIAGFAVCLGLAWGLLIFGELPPDVAPPLFAQTILNSQYTWVAKIWYLIHHVMLDTQLELSSVQLFVLAVIPWSISGIAVGMLSRNASKGFGVGLIAVVISMGVGWLILFLSPSLGIQLPGDGLIITFISDPLQYLLSLLSLQALMFCIVSGAGGALGGTLTRKRE
jgi:hypothetical protein